MIGVVLAAAAVALALALMRISYLWGVVEGIRQARESPLWFERAKALETSEADVTTIERIGK